MKLGLVNPGAMGATIGAAYAGSIAVTGTSGPGLALKTEAMGLAVMTELPMVIINVQRGGPSTGLPTMVGQADPVTAEVDRVAAVIDIPFCVAGGIRSVANAARVLEQGAEGSDGAPAPGLRIAFFPRSP